MNVEVSPLRDNLIICFVIMLFFSFLIRNNGMNRVNEGNRKQTKNGKEKSQ